MRASQPQQNQERTQQILLFNVVVMTCIIVLLGFPFGARLANISLPGSLWLLSTLGYGLNSPLTSFYKYIIQPVLPLNWQTSFPVTPLPIFLSALSGKPAAAFSQFSGHIEWLPLFSIIFWQGFLIVAYYCLYILKSGFSIKNIQEAVVEYKTTVKAQETRQAKQSAPVKTTFQEIQTQTPMESNPNDQRKVKDRLHESKNLQQKAPSIKKYTQQDWERYKQQEGQLVVRSMIQQLRQENLSLQTEKNELKSTFSQYFSPEVLKYLNQNKSAFEGIQNQHYTMSVLFCDLRGFSNYSQTVSSEELVAYLSEYFEIASYCVLHKYNGVISKLMGDGFMAYWGFPLSDSDHAYTATLAAQTILREVHLRNELKPNEKPLKVGIGIATGTVMVGNIGSMDFKDFTLIGVPVNLAARLQETTKQLGCDVLISENTYNSLNGRIACRDWGGTEIRGWQNTERVYTPKSD